jgi:hypothetical protein
MNKYEANFIVNDIVRSEHVIGKNWNDVSKKLRVIYSDQKIEIMSITLIQENIKISTKK